jgi:hypothetical protein
VGFLIAWLSSQKAFVLQDQSYAEATRQSLRGSRATA